MKKDRGAILAQVRELLALHAEEGLRAAEIGDILNVERYLISILLCQYRTRGHVRSTGKRGAIRFFLSPTAPDSPVRNQPVTPRPIRKARAGLLLPPIEDPAVGRPRSIAQVLESALASGLRLGENVKVTVCPGGIDTRFTIDPRQFEGGESVAEWRRRRQAGEGTR